jgi:DNA-binding NtrC family response regulator
VVDDDDDLGRAIVQFLRQKGLDAISYTSAEHLRTALETTSFDGYILDWVLGEESAADLLPVIRAKNPAGPVIILTGQIDAGAQESDLASALATYRAQLYEKPSQPIQCAGTGVRSVASRAIARSFYRIDDAGSPRWMRQAPKRRKAGARVIVSSFESSCALVCIAKQYKYLTSGDFVEYAFLKSVRLSG